MNDASGGARTSIHNWADPTGAGYQSTARWGVLQLVEASVTEPPADEPTVELGADSVRAGETVPVALSGFAPGAVVEIALGNGLVATASGAGTGRLSAGVAAAVTPTSLATITVDQAGAATVDVRIPAATQAGLYQITAAVDGEVLAAANLTVLAAAPGAGAPAPGAVVPGSGAGSLATTGATVGWLLAIAVALVATGTVLVRRRRRAGALG